MWQKRYEKAKKYGTHAVISEKYYYQPEYQENALDVDFVLWRKNDAFCNFSKPKQGSHDSGPFTGFFYGGFGTASFSRGATGFFDRWQLRQGVPVICPMDNACFEIRWESENGVFCRRLRVAEDGFAPGQMEHYGLFPFAYEKYEAEDMPFTVILESYSPLIPHNLKDSSLPVTLFNFYVIPKDYCQMKVSIALFWPNVLGWKPVYQTSELRSGVHWPTHQNAGNYSVCWQADETTVHVLQSREQAGEPDDLCGKVMLSLNAEGWKPSYEAMFKETRMSTGFCDQEQAHTIGRVQWEFEHKGCLSDGNTSWQAHWHEPTASALCAEAILAGEEKSLTFAITMDLPVTQFRMGRRWYKYYTELKGCSCAEEISAYALQKNQNWLEELEQFHDSVLEVGDFSGEIQGARINELYYVTSGGSVLVSKPVDGWDEETSRLGQHPHYGILEGFDTGYYYYNTLDLWVYGFAALSKHWPELAEWCFTDYLRSSVLKESRKNMIYRNGALVDNMVYGKLPHDLGNCAEDLFVRLNGYNFRDTPNMWKDHNPSFVLAYYLHKQICKMPVKREEYELLKEILEFTIYQDHEGCGIPRHNEFGDSTWDNLHMQGLSAYCGCLCIGAYAVMEHLAAEMEDPDWDRYRLKKEQAQKTMQDLWNGTCFVTSERGKYSSATMSDAMFGVMLAKLAGLGDLLPEKQVKMHLQTTYRNNALAFSNGKYGALLVAEPDVQSYEQDGGSELQVNEVIVGSSWIFAASLNAYGFKEEADKMAKAMFETIRKYGLQYRTPAAWNQMQQYRAPMNMRPLAVWLL